MPEENRNPMEWTAQDAKSKIPVSSRAPVLKRFYDGDHWQKAKQWIGPFPEGASKATSQMMLNEIMKIFTSKNVIKEVVDRRVGGVIGKEPYFTWTPRRHIPRGENPTDAEQDLIDEANAMSTSWWNEREVQDVMDSFLTTALVTEIASLRFYLPRSYLESDETGYYVDIPAGDIERALTLIWLEHPEVNDRGRHSTYVFRDPQTKQETGVHIFEDGDTERVEIVFREDMKDDATTYMRELSGNEQEAIPYEWDIGGRLTMYTVHHRLFITDQIVQLQNALNLALTMVPQNMTASSFLERIFMNALPPGDFQYDEMGNPIPGSFQAAPYVTGPNATSFLRGVEYSETDVDGNQKTTITSPSVTFRPPTPVTPLIEGKDALYADILDEADQAHYLLSGEAAPSGRSRSEARAEFMRTLRRTGRGADGAGRWTIETGMAMAEDLAGVPGKYTDTLRVDFGCRLDSGPISAEEQKVVIEAVEKRMKPLEHGMSEIGIDDTGAALVEISSQPGAELELMKLRGEVATIWTGAGTPLEVAAFLAGLRGEDLDELPDEQDDLQALYGDGTGVELAAENASIMTEAVMVAEGAEDPEEEDDAEE